MADLATAVVGGSLILKTFEQRNQAEAEKQALDLREQQEEIAAVSRENQRAQEIQRVISTQTANQAASGVSLSSPSFNAIQMNSINEFAQDEKLDALNFQFQKAAIDQQKSNVDTSFMGNLAGNLIDAASFYTNTRVPKVGNTAKSPIEDDEDPTELNENFGDI